ncbi:hypothetical protein Hdeb2414_s0012g00394181 [Helianthus debilis subsp. tardiflorus]
MLRGVGEFVVITQVSVSVVFGAVRGKQPSEYFRQLILVKKMKCFSLLFLHMSSVSTPFSSQWCNTNDEDSPLYPRVRSFTHEDEDVAYQDENTYQEMKIFFVSKMKMLIKK